MTNLLVRKFENYVRLSDAERAAFEVMANSSVRTASAREDIIREGEAPKFINLVLEGWACRYKMLEDGRRQIISFFLPGDLCDLHMFILTQMDHSIGTLTPVRFARISREMFEELTADCPSITQALRWDTLVTTAVQREWTVNIGQRNAFERIAHLICELHMRLRAIGRATDDAFEMPLTQVDISEATGMTPVHVNRTIQELRTKGLLEWRKRQVHIPDLFALRSAALFNPNYLHLDRERQSIETSVD